MQDNSGLINDFLQCAGYNYRISINEDEGNGFRMILSPVNSDMGITSANEHLSYGERNALALSLFMFSAIKENPDLIILQSRSPSCGIKQIYDGTFSGKKIPGQGLFAELCIKVGYKVLDIEDIDGYLSHN